MTTNKLRRESLSKQVSDQLEEMISNGSYNVGDKIPTEPELMKMFSVSRNTIREAIQSLTWTGLLTVRQGDGTYVNSTNRFNANMEQKYQQASLEDVCEARNCIEVTIAHLAAKRRTQEDIDTLTELLLRRKSLTTDIKENTRADIDFHIAIAHACHNQILTAMYDSIICYMENQITEKTLNTAYSNDEIDLLHEQLYQAIVDGSSKDAAHSTLKILEI